MKAIVSGALFVAALAVVQDGMAAGADLIKRFVAEVHGLKADFVQTVVDASGKPVSQSTGSFQFLRPGKFRWTYVKPYEQLIVGDGAKVWVYDRDLNQVTVKALGDALGSSPAALLAGSNDLDHAYTFAQLPKQDGFDWVEATPTDPDSQFEKMRLGFRKSNPESMELHDRLGQTTTIKFSRLERNPKFAADLFRFTPPAGADVVGDQ
jgi:outer membrane lipoprotein carrier protein